VTLFRLTGLILIAVPVAFNLLFLALGRSFEYPDILRQPVDTVLRRFRDGGSRLISLWYAFSLTAILFVPLALLVAAAFPGQPALAQASAVVGALAGVVQALGLLRWPFLVPVLARAYADPAASPAKREAVATVFEAFHTYAGVAIGEHLGYFFTAGWSILVSAILMQSAMFNPLIGVLGIVSAVGILAGTLEPAGWKPAAAINAISYLVWSLWLVAVGVGMIVA